MNVHQNARLTPHSRAELVRRVVVEGQTPTAVAAAFGVTVKTVHKWVARFQTEGVNGLHDRSSRPHHLRRPTPAATVATIETLRRQRWIEHEGVGQPDLYGDDGPGNIQRRRQHP